MADSWVELHNLALEVAGFFAVVSVSLSAYLILQHFTAFNKPEVSYAQLAEARLVSSCKL